MKNKKLLIFGSIVILIVLFFVIINIIPPTKVIENNLFVVEEGSLPMVVAHRGGKVLNPENTIKAFDASVEEYDVDVLEMDLCLTKDRELVIIHNLYVEKNCDATQFFNKKEDEHIYVNDYTYEELLQLNFGYKFEAIDGTKPYENILDGVDASNRSKVIKENNLNIVKIEELFGRYYTLYPNLKYIVEIKNDGDLGKYAADILNKLLTKEYPNLQDKVVIGTFHTEISNYLESKYPHLLTGASVGTAAKFIFTQMLGVNLFYNGSFTCLQIPTSYTLKKVTIKLTKQNYISRAHLRNIAVQVWTINDADDMRMLIDLKVDAIMTDNPKLLHEVLQEYK